MKKGVPSHESEKPRLSAIWLIYAREMRDQLRDRRTLFTIAVLPILLYPLVGTLLLQIAQFTRQHPTSVCVVGTNHLVDVPPLLEGEQFAEALAGDNNRLKAEQMRCLESIARSCDADQLARTRRFAALPTCA